MDVRQATRADADAIAVVVVDGWRSTYRRIVADAFLDGLTHQWQAERWRHGYLSAPDVAVLVAEEDDALVGVVAAGRSRVDLPAYDAELYALYVLPAFQRRGIGSTLLNAAAAALVTEGFRSMLVRVLRANRARDFYEAHGARMVCVRDEEIGGTIIPALVYGWEDLSRFLANAG